MPDMTEHMTVVFPEMMADRIREAVASGEYATASEAVQDAVALWSASRDLGESDVGRLGQAWDEGKASGAIEPYDINAILAEARVALVSRSHD